MEKLDHLIKNNLLDAITNCKINNIDHKLLIITTKFGVLGLPDTTSMN